MANGLMRKKNIAIIAGGDSSEHDVSMRSARALSTFIDNKRYNIYIVETWGKKWTVNLPDGQSIDVDKNIFGFQSESETVLFDYAYITIHGHPGENGYLQGYLGMLGVPHSSCDVLASALTFNKYVNNQFLKSLGFLVSDSIRLFKGQTFSSDNIAARLGLPVFVKPNDGGSSFGVTKVKGVSEMDEAIGKAFLEGKEVIIESFVKGTEVTCGCYKTREKQVVFPLTEIITSNDFFDYDAKYNGQVQEITPARISEEMTKRIQQESLDIYDLIDASGIIRIDYIISEQGNPVLLEVNTNPGMTETSFIPQQVRAAGLDIKDVLTEIIENS